MYQRIKELREDADLSQREVAAQLNCTQQTYSNYKLGHRDIPPEVLIRLAKLHHTSVDDLLGLTNLRTPYPKD